MPVTDSQKIDYIWKKVGYGVAKTDTNSNKYAVNESIASPLLGRGDTIWQLSGDIPATKPASSTDVVEVYAGSTLIECTADTSATSNRTWLTNLQDWIGIEFGSTYLVEVFIHTAGDPSGADDSANKVFITGSGNNDEWYFDYQAGVVNFIGTNLPNGVSFAGKSVYVKGARYIGPKGLPTVPTALSGLTNDTGFITINDVPSAQGFAIGGDDSTLRYVNPGESFKIIGGTNVTTSTDAEGNITINSTGGGGGSSVTKLSELTNDVGFITSAEEYNFKIGADDSTARLVDNGEQINILGGANVTTTSDGEGNITITASQPTLLSELANDTGFITLADIPASVSAEEYSFKVAADDSTERTVDNGEAIQFIGGTNISTSSDAEGNITITNDFTQDFAYGSLTGVPVNVSDFNNDAGYITLADLPPSNTDSEEYSFKIGADDSTARVVDNGEQINILGGANITTTSDAEGNITITAAQPTTLSELANDVGFITLADIPAGTESEEYSFKVAADDSTERLVDNGETIQFIGATGITTSSDAEGNITITGTAQDFAYSSLTGAPTIPSTTSELTNDAGFITLADIPASQTGEEYSFRIGADDSTARLVDNGEQINILGGTNISTTSDAEGNITITNDFTQDFAYSSLTGTPTIPTSTSDLTNDSGFITLADLPPSNTEAEEYSFKIGADDSTARVVDNGEQINIIGGTNISTTSDAEGNITVTNDFVQDFAYSSLTGAPSIPGNVSELVNDAGYITQAEEYSFSISADDSTANVVDNGEQIQITGGSNITTTSDGEGNITINNTLSNLSELNNDYGYALLTDDISNFNNDAGYITGISVTADDSSSVSADSISIVGGQNISTSINSSSNVEIALDTGLLRFGDTIDDNTLTTQSGHLTLRSATGDIRLFGSNFSDTRIPFITDNNGTLATSSNFTFNDAISQLSTGNLVLSNSATLGGNLIFEGATDDAFETTIQVTDPTADRTITFKDESGTVAFLSDLPTVPTAVSELTNDTGFITNSAIPTNLSDFANDVGYITTQYDFKISADDSTERTISSGESIQIIGGDRISTTSDAEGNITITGDIRYLSDLENVSVAGPGVGQILTWGGSQWEPQDAPVSGSGGSGTGIAVGADDSTLRNVNGGESVLFLGGARITTASDAEGAITFTGEVPAHISETPPSNPEEGELWWESDSGKQYVYYDGYWVESTNQGTPTFSVDYADVANTPDISGFIEYSDLSVVTAGVPTGNGSLAFNQGTGVFTHTPANVRETIGELDNVSDTTPNADQALIWTGSTWAPGDVVQSIGDLNNVSSATPGVGQALVWGGSQWEPQDQSGGSGGGVGGGTGLSVGADDSTLRFIAGGESIKFIGGTNISTSSDAEGNITINNDGTSLTIGENAPSGPNEGELWWESDTGRLYVYYDSYWVQADGNTDAPSTEGLISKATLKEITAASTSFTDFQARIAAL